jgi:hypothetical protein
MSRFFPATRLTSFSPASTLEGFSKENAFVY